MKRIVGGALALALAGCGSQVDQNLHASESFRSRSDILAELAAKPDGDNVIWSAASLDGLLTLVGLGYDDERQGLLEKYLQASVKDKAKSSSDLNVSQEGLTVQAANNVWTRKDFHLNDEYKNDLANFFNGLKPETMDVNKPVETADKVNQWASDHTNEMIKNILKPDMVTPDLASLLANALYFKGTWQEEFDPKLTKASSFNTVSKQTGKVSEKNVATMHKFGAKVQVGESGKYTTIRLPYQGDTHAMYIAFASTTNQSDRSFTPVVTQVDVTRNVADVYRKYIVDGEAFAADYSSMATYDKFTMPKFTIETTLEGIHSVLSSAGYGALFQTGVLTRMTNDPRAQLSFILQKAKIIVNEEGSEAAAVTIGGVRTTSITTPNHLEVNGPFAYAIRDDVKGVTLFEGIVRSPAE